MQHSTRQRVCKLWFLAALIFFSVAVSFAAPVQTYDQLLTEIRAVQKGNASPIKSDVKQAGLREAWGTGKLINEYIFFNGGNNTYSGPLLERLAHDLDTSANSLRHKSQFASAYSEVPITINLTWSHYIEIIPINDLAERVEIARQAEIGKWSTRKLRKEIKEHQYKTAESEKIKAAAVLAEIKPGKPGFCKIVKINGELKAEQGFDIYREAPSENVADIEENQIILGTGKYFIADPDARREDLYTYNAAVIDVVDGDTFHAAINLGFGTTITKRLRLRRIDAPELKETYGEQAKAALADILKRNRGNIMLKVARGNDQDNYGRYLVDVFVNEKNIDQELVDTTLFTIRS